MSKERWKSIKNFPGYEVSDHGRIKSVARVNTIVSKRTGNVFTREVKERIRVLGRVKGYLYTELWHEGTAKTFQVHRLVAKAFILNPHKLPQVLHKDDNPENNHYRNLWWGTHDHNMKDKTNKGRQLKGSKHHKAVLTEKDIPRIRRLVATGTPCDILALKYGVTKRTIMSAAHGKSWKHVPYQYG